MSTAAVAHHHQPPPPSRLGSSNPFARLAPKKAMSITQTYYLAHKARAKLSREAAQPDHDLRLLVGHANLLDSLMLELADAEREQEHWFNQSVRGASKRPTRHVQWVDRIVEEAEDEYDSDSDSDLDDDLDEDDFDMADTAAGAQTPAPAHLRPSYTDVSDDLEEDYAQLELVRIPSHASSPPELIDHDSDTSDDESMPPSPADPVLPYSEREAKENQSDDDSLYQEDKEEYYVPRPNPASLVSAISVY